MKNKDKWAENLKIKMQGHSEPLPDNLWERMEAEMSSRRHIPMWKTQRFASAAAAIAIVVATALTVWLAGLWTEDHPHTPQPVADEVKSPVFPQPETVSGQREKEERITAVRTGEVPMPVSGSPVARAEESPMISPEDEKPRPEESTVAPQPENAGQTESVSEKDLMRSRRKADREQMQRNSELLAEARHKGNRSWSVSLNAGNTPFSSSNSYNGMGSLSAQNTARTYSDIMLLSMSGEQTAYSQVLFNSRDQISTTSIHHRMPVTTGISFKWHLTSRWALETGLSYTFLSSSLHSGTDVYLEEEQKLHYIGIPLKVHRSLFDSRWVSFYVSAGGMVERCVSGSLDVKYVNDGSTNETEHQSLDINKLQWSVSGAAGIQVNFTRLIGVYAEPGIIYYFDDNSEVETIRKDYPFNFNLQVGLRFSFSR